MKVIDELFVRLGFAVDPKGLNEMKRQAEGARASMLSFGSAISTLVSGFAISKIAQIGSTFEQNRIAIAGFLSALGVSTDFNAGLEDAQKTIESITLAAAKLPGEAEEYVEVFKAGLPFLVKAIPGGDLNKITDFTNQFTAIGKTLGVDAQQIGRDLALMLGTTGRAGAHVRTFQQMVPFMRQVEGQANLTAQSFNAMTSEKRAELLQASFVRLQPMLDASADSFDAMFGAAKSTAVQLTRLATAGIFKGMKAALSELTALFFNVDGKLTDLGKSVVDTGKQIGEWVVKIAKAVAWLGKLLVSSSSGRRALILFTAAVVGLKKILTGGLLGVIALIVEDLFQFETGGKSVTGMLVNKWAPALTLIKGLLGLLIAALFRTQIAALLTGARMHIAWLLSLGPIGLIILALEALGVALFLLGDNWEAVVGKMKKTWDGFVDSFKKVPHEIAKSFGFGTDAEKDFQKRFDAAVEKAKSENGGMITLKRRAEIAKSLREQDARPAMSADPSAFMSGAEVAGSISSINNTSSRTQITHVTGTTINITTNDPKEAGREVNRSLIRNAQSAVAM